MTSCDSSRPRCWPTTRSSKSSSARCRSIAWKWAPSTVSSSSRVPLRELDDEALVKLSRRRAALSVAGRDADDSAHFRDAGPRPDRRRAGNDRPDLERALQPQDARRPHRLSRRPTASGGSRTCSRKRSSPRRRRFASSWATTTGASACSRTTPASCASTTSTTSCFKVETHNHPSALEPYGGANTGIGGVIRDPLGTGLGAKPICNTDVFCFAPPDTPADSLPPGVLHPRRVMQGVVAGVRDYGNRMGIPTVNGAIYFDPRYLGNPLVYCGNVGLMPRDKSFKEPQAGRSRSWPSAAAPAATAFTARRSARAELTSESETLSGGAVQIGNAITEKMVLDVVLAGPRPGAVSTRSPIAAPAAFPAPSARWARRSAPRSGSTACR